MAEVDTMPVPLQAPVPSEEAQNPLSETVEDPSTTALTTTTSDQPGPKKIKKIVKKKRRPARVQVDPSTLKSEPPPQTGTIFNICK